LLRLLAQNQAGSPQPQSDHPFKLHISRTPPGPPIYLVYIDCNLRADDTPQAFYELVWRSLLRPLGLTTSPAGTPASLSPQVEVFNKLYQELTSGAGFNFFLVAVEKVMAFLDNTRLVLLLDEFDQPLANLPPATFRQLRALHDHFEDRLSYLVATRLPVMVAAGPYQEEKEDLAEFLELFDQFPSLRLGSLSQSEAEEVTKQTLASFGLATASTTTTNLRASQFDYLYSLAGGHPVLTRLMARILVQALAESDEEENITFWEESDEAKKTQFELAVRADPQIIAECQRIWQSLHPSEQVALGQWLEGVRSSQAGPLGTLSERGLVNSEGKIFSQVFEWFVKSHFQSSQGNGAPVKTNQALSGSTTPLVSSSVLPSYTEVAYDPRHQIVIFEGGARRVTLSGNAALLFDYLFRRQSLPYCTKDELISAIWGPDQAYSFENLDRLVSDLRQMLGDHDKLLIRTIHRRGLQMSPDVRLWNSANGGEFSSA
jgi:DNA-binding winged helix-turn-helix (wHTH) protein